MQVHPYIFHQYFQDYKESRIIKFCYGIKEKQ